MLVNMHADSAHSCSKGALAIGQDEVLSIQPGDTVLLWASPPCEEFSRMKAIHGNRDLAAGDACVRTVMRFVR